MLSESQVLSFYLRASLACHRCGASRTGQVSVADGIGYECGSRARLEMRANGPALVFTYDPRCIASGAAELRTDALRRWKPQIIIDRRTREGGSE